MIGVDALAGPEPHELSLEYQRKIFNFIQNNPGLHLRRIERDLAINIGTLRHHLRYLEKNHLITSKMDNNLKIYYASGKMGKQDKEISSILQQKRFRDIILTIILKPGITPTNLSEELLLKLPTLSKYLKILEDRDLIIHEKVVREKHYFVRDEGRIMELLLTYKKSFWDSFVDNMLRIYFER